MSFSLDLAIIIMGDRSCLLLFKELENLRTGQAQCEEIRRSCRPKVYLLGFPLEIYSHIQEIISTIWYSDLH